MLLIWGHLQVRIQESDRHVVRHIAFLCLSGAVSNVLQFLFGIEVNVAQIGDLAQVPFYSSRECH